MHTKKDSICIRDQEKYLKLQEKVSSFAIILGYSDAIQKINKLEKEDRGATTKESELEVLREELKRKQKIIKDLQQENEHLKRRINVIEQDKSKSPKEQRRSIQKTIVNNIASGIGIEQRHYEEEYFQPKFDDIPKNDKKQKAQFTDEYIFKDMDSPKKPNKKKSFIQTDYRTSKYF